MKLGGGEFTRHGPTSMVVCLRDARLGNFLETQGHHIVSICLLDERLVMKPLGKSRSSCCQGVLPRCQVEELLGKLRTIILSEHASAKPGWGTVGNLKTIILPEYTSKVTDWKTFGKLNFTILLGYASKMPG